MNRVITFSIAFLMLQTSLGERTVLTALEERLPFECFSLTNISPEDGKTGCVYKNHMKKAIVSVKERLGLEGFLTCVTLQLLEIVT